jgi:hypothetical protein
MLLFPAIDENRNTLAAVLGLAVLTWALEEKSSEDIRRMSACSTALMAVRTSAEGDPLMLKTNLDTRHLSLAPCKGLHQRT